MRSRTGISLLAAAFMTPLALANGNGPNSSDELDNISLPALRTDASVSFKPGHGFRVDGGDEYSLNLTNRIQAGWRYSNLDMGQDQMTFYGRRVRSELSGHVFGKETRYFIQLEWASGGGNTLDTYIEQDLWSNDEWSLIGRAGQMKPLYGKEATGWGTYLFFTERSLAARTLTSEGRVLGGLAELRGMDDHFFAHLGIFNAGYAGGSAFNSGFWQQNSDNEMNYTVGARYEFGENMGDLWFAQGDLDRSEELRASIHGNLWIGNERATAGGQTGDVDVFAFNVGGAVKTGGISGLAEYFGWSGDPDFNAGANNDQGANGFNVQVTYTADANWGFGGRVSMVSVDAPATLGGTGGNLMTIQSAGGLGGGTTLAGKGDVTEFSLGVSRFFNAHDRKLQADITFQNTDPSGGGGSQDNIIFRVLATLSI
ncbi:MAG: hypothetical protein KDC95_14955 [Planctomycetes bacterium]|nr:hypothetical protein [Planctomycetota bacterium]